MRYSPADDDFDGSGWDGESNVPRAVTDDGHYDYGSKKYSREQQFLQIPRQINFNNIYEDEIEQQNFHSRVLALLPTLEQLKSMLHKVC